MRASGGKRYVCMGLYVNISLRFVHTRQKSQISDVSAAFISDEGRRNV